MTLYEKTSILEDQLRKAGLRRAGDDEGQWGSNRLAHGDEVPEQIRLSYLGAEVTMAEASKKSKRLLRSWSSRDRQPKGWRKEADTWSRDELHPTHLTMEASME